MILGKNNEDIISPYTDIMDQILSLKTGKQLEFLKIEDSFYNFVNEKDKRDFKEIFCVEYNINIRKLEFFVWLFISDFVILTWVGQKPMKDTYVLVGQIATAYYFLFFLILIPVVGKIEYYLAHYKSN